MNRAGTALAQGASPSFVEANFPGVSGVRLARWTLQGSAWVAANLGRPGPQIDPNSGVQFACTDLVAGDMSDDGNTIIGKASYGGTVRPFIWRPTINGGVPMDLKDYIASINPGNPLLAMDFVLLDATNVSGDGNAILLQYQDQRNTCAFGGPSLGTYGAGVLYLNGASCQPPQLALPPGDWAKDSESRLGVSLNAFASGSWPLTYQWQHEDPSNPGAWLSLSDDCTGFPPIPTFWAYEGTGTNQLRIGTGQLGADRAGRYRVVVTNSCGSVTSDPGTVTFLSGACCARARARSCTRRLCHGRRDLRRQRDDVHNGCRTCGTADFNCDGDIGTDAD